MSAQILCSTVMKNITLKIDDQTYQKARVRAAEEGTSVSAMVREFLISLEQERNNPARSESDRVERLLKLYEEADSQAPEQKAAAWTFNRDECYEERLR
jgi:plasmid stability protein